MRDLDEQQFMMSPLAGRKDCRRVTVAAHFAPAEQLALEFARSCQVSDVEDRMAEFLHLHGWLT
jgi:hypothetical protein